MFKLFLTMKNHIFKINKREILEQFTPKSGNVVYMKTAENPTIFSGWEFTNMFIKLEN